MPKNQAPRECAGPKTGLDSPLINQSGRCQPVQDSPLNMRNEIRRQLEQLCGYPLPAAWQQLISNYPHALLTAGRGDENQHDEGTVAQVELLSSDSAVLQINLEVRHGTFLDPHGMEFHWPTAYLVIGETGDGDYYCLDAAAQTTAVLQYRSHAVKFENAAESLEEFIELLLVAFTEDDPDDPELLSEFTENESDECTDQYPSP
jgi:hypothetical protein